MKLDATISKSLNDIENAIALTKSITSDEVSNDVPQSQEEGTPEEDVNSEDEEGEEEGTGEEAPVDNDEVPMEKSMEEQLTSGDNVRKALEVSDFLSELVKGLSSVLAGQQDTINKSITDSNESQQVLMKSFEGIAKAQVAVLETQANLAKSIKQLSAKVTALETAPVVRKSVSSATQVIEKSFNNGAKQGGVVVNNTQSNQPINLNKSMALAKLSDLCKSDNSLVQDVLALESTGDPNSLSDHAKSVLGIL